VIRMRDDDVLVSSSSWPDVFGRFRQVHRWIVSCPKMIHVPTILTEELEDFPDCVDFILRETAEGRMRPELHGAMHVDYGAMPEQGVREHLDESIDWMQRRLNVRPEFWYTPWGAESELLTKVAGEFGLHVIGTDRERQANKVTERLRNGRYGVGDIPDEMFFHWWEGGCRIARLAAVVNHGSWEEASLRDPELFL
jgi:peptidoglycan/xylan/chitin deacetylase (PgdA/CDA1 family)